MANAPMWRRYLRFWGPDPKADLDQEFAFHVEALTERLIAQGKTPRDAQAEAARRFGDRARVERECLAIDTEWERQQRWRQWLDDLRQDLGQGVRALARARGFTGVACLILALGIGANTALFTVVNGVLLRPLPFGDPERLVMIWHDNQVLGLDSDPLSFDTFAELRRRTRTVQGLTGISPAWDMVVGTFEGPQQRPGYFVSASLVPVLGIQMARGRWFLESEDQPGGTAVAVVSSRFWQQRFGHVDLSGQTLTLNGVSTTIVGVMPPNFRLLDEVDIWAPLGQNPLMSRGRNVRWLSVVGRLADRVTLDDAQREVAGIADQIARQFPASNQHFSAHAVPLTEQIVGSIRPALLVLLAAVGLLLLITCANVANLQLGRATVREREMAIRTALGSSRSRLIRQLLTESVLLGLLAGGAGLLVATGGVDLLRTFGPADLPRLDEVRIDRGVLGFAALLSLATALLFGLVPALLASSGRLGHGLKAGGRSQTGARGVRIRRLLVISETALALMLLVSAGLLIHSFSRLMGVDAGFDPRNVLTLEVGVGGPRFEDDATRRALWERLFDALERLPGVEAVGGVTRLPLGSGVTSRIEIEGRGTPEAERPELEFRRAGRRYFDAMGIPLVTGRLFASGDQPDTPPIAIVNDAAARRYWPGEEVLGKRLRLTGGSPAGGWLTIVGVVGDVRHFGLDIPASAEVYVPFTQGAPSGPLLAIRAVSDPAALGPAVRQAIRQVEPTMVVAAVETMAARVTASVAQRRFTMLMIALVAGLALVLAAVGIYGVMNFAVAQRLREIGIRLALGAHRRDILRLIVAEGLELAAVGVAVGLAAALALTRFLASLLFGVGPLDPLTFIGVGLLLGGVAVLACYVPARRAARIDPATSLRTE